MPVRLSLSILDSFFAILVTNINIIETQNWRIGKACRTVQTVVQCVNPAFCRMGAVLVVNVGWSILSKIILLSKGRISIVIKRKECFNLKQPQTRINRYKPNPSEILIRRIKLLWWISMALKGSTFFTKGFWNLQLRECNSLKITQSFKWSCSGSF